MISNKNLQKKELDFSAHKNKKKNIKDIIHEDTKTNYNNKSPITNLFLTKIDHKGESKNSQKNISMRTKYITDDKTFGKTKDNLIPEQKKVIYDPTFLTMNNSFIKTKSKIINNNKKNKSVKTMRINNTFCTKEQYPKMTNII